MRLSHRYFNVIRSVAVACLIASGTVFGASWTEKQTVNELVNGSQGWIASYGTSQQQVSTNGYLAVNGVGGAGQYFAVNQQSKYQIATLIGSKAGSGAWAGFGVTYYDASWNEISVQFKEIKADLGLDATPTRYAIGLVPPSNAVWAYMWVWNNNRNGFVHAGDFRCMNYFPEGNFSYDPSAPAGSTYTQTFPETRNRIVNGNFETRDRFEADEYWNVVGSDGSVYYDEYISYTLGGYSYFRMGSETEVNMIYQYVSDLQPGQAYTFNIKGGRAGGDVEGSPYVVAGVDFYDANWNKLGDESKAMTKGYSSTDFVNFTPPNGTVNTVAWVWAQPEATFLMNELSIRPREYTPPRIELGDIRGPFDTGWTVKITDSNLDTDTIDSNDFVFVGPDGVERLVWYQAVPPRLSGGWPRDHYTYYLRSGSSAPNGTYKIYYQNNEIGDTSGNLVDLGTNNLIGAFEINR